MTPEQQGESRAIEDKLLEQLDDIDQSLLDNLADDARFQSGVPEDQRAADIDFIQMSGLTTPETARKAEGTETPPGADTLRPVSFYEKGVKDVDPSMAPGAVENGREATQEIEPEPAQGPPPDLRDVLAQQRASRQAAVVDLPEPEPSQEISGANEEPAQTQDVVEPDVLPAELLAEEEATELPADYRAPDAREAERYIEELQAQTAAPPDVEEKPTVEVEQIPAAAPASQGESWETPPLEEGEEEEEEPSEALHQRRRTHGRFRRRLIRLCVAAVCVTLIAGGAYYAFLWFQHSMASPETLLNEANSLAAQKEYDRAYGTYLDFVRRYPNHPDRGTAQFSAAFMLQLGREDAGSRPQAAYEGAIQLLGQFVKDNPAHAKTARAETLIGILNFRLGRYEEAINHLRDPELRLRDPGAALAILRTLARSHAMVGDFAQAQSTFLQAATLESNSTPDMDYDELGNIFAKKSDSAQTETERVEYQESAIEHWKRAVQCPGIPPTTRNEVRTKIDVLQEKMRTGLYAEGAPAGETHQEEPASAPPVVEAESAPTAGGGDELAPAPAPAEPAASEPKGDTGSPSPASAQPAEGPAPSHGPEMSLVPVKEAGVSE